MKFGIMPLSFVQIIKVITESILEGRGIEGLSSYRYSEIIKSAAEAGYEHCEITLDYYQAFPISINNEEIKAFKNIKKEYDISYSAHFPIVSIDPASPNQFIREGSVKALVDSYSIFKQLEDDIDVFVLHPSGETVAELLGGIISNPEVYHYATDFFADYAIQSIKEFINETGIDRNKIAIENIIFPFEGTMKIIEKLNTKLCIDTAHFLAGYSGNVDLIEITEKYLEITSEIHLQGYTDQGTSDHCALGEGKNFPNEFLKLIHNYDFKGPIVFELLWEEARKSLEYIKKHVPEIKVPEIKFSI